MAKTKIPQKTVKDFYDYDFESCDVPEDCYGDYSNANFFKKYFIPILRKELKKMAEEMDAELVKFNPGHFIASGFFRRDGGYVYFSISDVRYWKWYDEILYRSASSDTDYRGGANGYSTWDDLKENINDKLPYDIPF